SPRAAFFMLVLERGGLIAKWNQRDVEDFSFARGVRYSDIGLSRGEFMGANHNRRLRIFRMLLCNQRTHGAHIHPSLVDIYLIGFSHLDQNICGFRLDFLRLILWRNVYTDSFFLNEGRGYDKKD